MATQEELLQIENLKGAISLATEGLKSLILVNGGAAIGILTFYGNALKEEGTLHVARNFLTMSLASFGFGVSTSLFAFIFAYCSQLTVATPPTAGYTREQWIRREFWTRIVAISLSFASAVLFVAGVLLAGNAFN